MHHTLRRSLWCGLPRIGRALPAITLSSDIGILTATGNDYGFNEIFARQVAALGIPW